MKKFIIAITIIGFGVADIHAQNVSAKTNKFEIDYSDPAKLINTKLPIITWLSPTKEYSQIEEKQIEVRIKITSKTPLKSVTLVIKEELEESVRGSKDMEIIETEKFEKIIEQKLNLADGENYIEVVAENSEGGISSDYRTVLIGSNIIADAATMDRQDFALLFATDKYDHWNDLVNPINDARIIADELKAVYGFDVELVENPNQDEIMVKLREYADKTFKPQDQLFIFFAGHGQFDESFGEGYVVAKNSLRGDKAKTSYISHSNLRTVINNINSEHIFLTMDVCYGGTFDPTIASRQSDEVYKEPSQSEFIKRKLKHRTRRYLTSGGKEYVSDGIPGQHSPFARRLLEGLRARGGNDHIVTLTELMTFLERANPHPSYGEFGDNEPGSDFVFVVK